MIKATKHKDESPDIIVWTPKDNVFHYMSKGATCTTTEEGHLTLSGYVTHKVYDKGSVERQEAEKLKSKLKKALKILNS